MGMMEGDSCGQVDLDTRSSPARVDDVCVSTPDTISQFVALAGAGHVLKECICW